MTYKKLLIFVLFFVCNIAIEGSAENIQEIDNHTINKRIQEFRPDLYNAVYLLRIKKDCLEAEKLLVKPIESFIKELNFPQAAATFYSEIGSCYISKKEYDKASTVFVKAIELDPSKAEYFQNMGLCFVSQEKYDKAISEYTKAIELEPNTAEYYADRGLAYSYKKDCISAANDLSKAAELWPKSKEYVLKVISECELSLNESTR